MTYHTNTHKSFDDEFNQKNYLIKDIIPEIGSNGDFKEIYDIDVIINSIKNLLHTPIGSYPHDPEYGIGITEHLFTPANQDNIDELRKNIKRKIRQYETRAQIIIDIKLLDKETLEINFTINFNGKSKKKKIQVDSNHFLKEFEGE